MFRRNASVLGLAVAVSLSIAASGLSDEPNFAAEVGLVKLPELGGEIANPNGPGMRRLLTREDFTPELMTALKTKYPFKSLAERLSYEAPARNAAAPKLSQDATERLQAVDKYWGGTDLRTRSLQILHTRELQGFIDALGNGVSRMPQPSPNYILLPPAPAIDFAKVPPLSPAESKLAPTSLLADEAPQAGPVPSSLLLLPKRSEMFHLHEFSIFHFADLSTFGMVKSRQESAGFEPHAFRMMPYTPVDANQPTPPGTVPLNGEGRWLMARLELVSLLKHETPRVYESKQLPSMQQLSSKTAPTRALDEFETAALEILRNGDDMHTASTPNRILMLGSIRANKHCTQCHDVPQGTLLGAFSYDLRRDPPIKLDPVTVP